jgi:transcriptional regulator with XRE-family HTH domain
MIMRLEVILGLNVRRLRNAAGLTQEELAAEVGIDMRYLGGIERGQENPSLAVIGELAKALRTPAASLLIEAKQR